MIPEISVVIPLYNKQDSVGRSITSILNQSFQNYEIIVVNDGSTDLSTEVINEFNDERIRIFNQVNLGVSAARNRGIQESKSAIITFLDADDLWAPTFLERIINLSLEFPSAGWMATAYTFHVDNQDPYEVRLNKLPINFRYGLLDNYFMVAAFSDPPVHSSAVAVRKDAIKSIKGFPIGVQSGEDLLTWAKLAANFPLAYDRSPSSFFIHSGIHRPPDINYVVFDELKRILKKHPHLIGLKEYIGLWNRMQSVSAIRSN